MLIRIYIKPFENKMFYMTTQVLLSRHIKQMKVQNTVSSFWGVLNFRNGIKSNGDTHI